MQIIQKKVSWYVFVLSISAGIFFIVFNTIAFAALQLNSVFPNQGSPGQNLEVTLKGSGFDKNTRISMTLDVGNLKTVVGFINTPGIAHGIVIGDNKCYIADGPDGLKIIDLTDKTKPSVIGSIDTPGHAYAMAIVGDKAYVADGANGMQDI